MSNKINKKKLWRLISQRNPIIHSLHTFIVLNLLVEELKKELLSNNMINIGNFGKFYIKTYNSRIHNNIVSGYKTLSKGKRALKLIINKKILKITH
jgi:nucleoid DNA-binding protein